MRFKGRVKILSTRVSSVGNLQLSVGKLLFPAPHDAPALNTDALTAVGAE